MVFKCTTSQSGRSRSTPRWNTLSIEGFTPLSISPVARYLATGEMLNGVKPSMESVFHLGVLRERPDCDVVHLKTIGDVVDYLTAHQN